MDDAKANLDILVKEIAEAPSIRNGAQADENLQKLSLELEVHCSIPAEPWVLNQQRHGAWADSLPLAPGGCPISSLLPAYVSSAHNILAAL